MWRGTQVVLAPWHDLVPREKLVAGALRCTHGDVITYPLLLLHRKWEPRGKEKSETFHSACPPKGLSSELAHSIPLA